MKIPILGKSFLWFGLFKECVTGLRYYSVSLVVFFLLFLFPFLSFAQFPYKEDFRGTEAPGVTFGGIPNAAMLTAGKTLSDGTQDGENDGYLRLTNKEGDQTGYIYSDRVFLGNYGLHIEFDYFTYGGTGADGICFFLFDAAVPTSNFSIGAFGGSLGYAQKKYTNSSGQNVNAKGVSKGYLGIGLDEYGNFSAQAEGRNSGASTELSPDAVVLRGAGDGYNTNANNYKYLTSALTNTGANAFKIAGGKRGAVVGEPEYRRVIINLEPRVGGGLIINVSIKHGNIVTPLIVNEPYSTAVPAAGLKYGIASSTGGATNYHEVRGLEITVDETKLGTPVAKDDFQSFCQGYSTQVNIFANDVLTNGGGKPDYDKVDLNPLTVGVFEQVMTRPGGTFSFNKVTKNVDFVPTPGFIGSESIQYLFQDLYGKASNSATIKVETLLPVITQQPVISPICENQDFSVTVTGNGGSSAGVLSYQWQYFNDIKNDWEDQLDGNGISGARTNTLTSVNTPLSNNGLRYRVKLTSTSRDAKCEVYSVPATLTVNPLPAATISAVTPVCPGSPDVGLTFTGSKGTAPYTFTYTINNGTPQTVTSATGSSSAIVYQSAAVSGDFVYKITSVSDASSTHCSVAQAVSSTVTVRPPATKPTITAGSEEFCQGTSLSISSSAESGNQWYKDGELIPGATEIDYLVTVAGKYTVSFTNSDGCTTFSDPRTILVNPRPTKPILTSPSLSYCQNGGVLITSTEAASYFWFKNGTAIKVNGVLYNERTYLATEPGNYSVIVLSEKGCQSNPSNTLTITENSLPAAPTVTASATSFCAGSSVVLTSSSASGNQWYKDDVLITGANGATYTVTDAGSYKVVFTNDSGCSASSGSTDITIIPDPTITLTSDVSTISQVVCKNISITKITYAVTNATGVTISGLPSSFTTNFNPTTKIFTINGSAAVSGEYSYTVSTTGGCTIASLTGKITVSPDASIALTSGNANPSVCVNTGINEIKYTISNAVGFTITGLPKGVYKNISGSVITISGNPNEVGEFPYTITTTGGCSSATISGIITSKALATVNKPDNQVLCNDKNSTTVEFSSNVVGTTYSWTNNDSSIGLADSGTGNIGSFKAVNNSNSPVTATITVRPSSATGCVAGSETFTITVNPTAKLTKPIDQVNCNGTTTSRVVFSGPVANTTYSWSIDHPEIGLTAGTGGEIAAFTATNTTRFPVVATITVTPSANGCPGEEQSFTITVNPKPTVEKPASFEICNDVTTAKVVFAQVAGKEVNGTTFSWTIDRTEIGLNAGTGSEIAAFKAINLTNEPIIATITVTPIATSCLGDAETFTITVNPTPTVATPASFEVCNDKTTTRVNFTQVTGKEVSGTTFSWTNNKPGIGLAGSGTGDIESFKAVNLTNAPIIATITVIPTATSCPGASKTFTITVNPTPTVEKPASIEVCNDAMTTPVTFTQVTGKELSGTTFSWTNDKPGIGLAGSGTGDIESFKAVNLTNAPIIATITVIPTATSCPGVPQTFTIIVNPTPTVEKPASIEVCTDANTTRVTFTQVAGKEVTGTTFNWTNDKPGIGLAGSGTGDMESFKAINLTNAPIIATITVTPVATSCPGEAKTFTITVNPTPTVEKPASIEVCNDAMTTPVTFTQVAGKEVNGTTFSWTNDKPGIGLAVSGTGDIASFKAINLTNAPIIATITVIPTATACPGAPKTFTITVNPTPTVEKPALIELCNDATTTPVTFTQIAGKEVAGTTFSWTNNKPGIGLAGSGTGDIASFKAINLTNVPIIATITVIPTATACPGDAKTFTITVNPTPTVEKPASIELCNDATTTPVTFTQIAGKEVAGTTFSWTNNKPGIGLAGSGTGDIASFKAINLTNAPIIATITVIPTATACPGDAKTFTITVNPTPTVEKPASIELCNDAMTTSVTFTQAAGKEVNGTTFSWTNDKPGIGLAASGTGDIASFKAINLTNAPIIATITVIPTATACPGAPKTFTIIVNPTPTVEKPASIEVCNDVMTAPVAFTQIAGKEVTGTTFSWTNNKPGIGLAGSGTGDIESFKAINITNAPIIATITVIPTATACPGVAETFTITVNPTPTVEKPASIEVCNDAMTTRVAFTQIAGKEVTGTTFSWTNDQPGIGLAGSGTGNIESFKAINLTNAPIIATITVIPTATACPGAPKTFTITVNPTPTVGKPASFEVCNDAMTTALTFAPVAGKEVTGTTFSWTNDKPGIGLAGSGTGDIASFKAINLTNAPIIATITVIPAATACPGVAETFTITVNPTPTVVTPASIEVCNDAMSTPVTFTQIAGKEVAGTTFSWTNNESGIGLAGSETGDIASFKAINLTNAPIIATITVIPTATACPGAPKTFTITVNPTPTVEKPVSMEVCNDAMTTALTFAPVAGKEVTGTTFSWTNDKPGIGLAGSGTGDIASFKAINLTNAPIIATITVIPTATACPGAPKTFTITVNPTPTVEKPASKEVCNDAMTTPVTFSQVIGKEVTGTTFSWTNDQPGIGLASLGTGNIASFKAINLTNAPIIATITVIPTATACPGVAETFTITVNPTPTVEKPASIEVCNDAMTAPVTFTQVAGKEVTGTIFSWTNNKPGIGLAGSGTGDIESFKAINLTNAPIIATITVIPTATACPGAPKTFTITVNPTPTVAAPVSFEVCNDVMTTPVAFAQVAGKEVNGTTFSWTNDQPGIGLARSGTGYIESFQAINLTNAPIIATITVIPTATACPGAPKTFTITVNPTPTVAEPVSFEVCNDVMTTPVTFTQIASKEVTGTTFTWTNDKPGIGLAGSGTGNIAGFTAINLTNAPIIATVTVTPTATACPGVAKIFTITVNPTPTVATPASFEVCNDVTTAPVIFAQVAGKEVTGTTFSWTNDKPGIGLVGSGNGDIESFKAINLSNAPIIATITVTPTATACPGAPKTFTITVNPTPTVALPSSFEVCNDATTALVSFAQVAGKEVNGTTFSWTNDKPGIGLAGSGSGNIAGFKAINLTNAPIIATITVTPIATGCPGAPKTFTITVNPTPTVEKPASFEVCNDVTTAPVIFAQVAVKEVNGTTFSWTNDKPGIGLAGSGRGDIGSFKAINLTNAPIIATITVTPTATACPGAPKTFTITVNPTPTVALPSSFEVCNDATTALVSFAQVAGKEVNGTTFSWTNDKPGIGLAGSGTGNIAGFKAINLTNAPIIATITVTPIATGCPGAPKTFTITVNPTPTVEKPASFEVCNDVITAPVIFAQVAGKEVNGTTFSWTNNKPGIGLAGSGTGAIESFKAINLTNAPIIATITVTPIATACPGDAKTFTITVNPTPTVEKPSSIEVCNDATTTPVNFMQVAGKEVIGTTFSWTNDKPEIGLAGSGTGDIESFKAINLTNAPIIATITVTATATGCPGASKTFTITVNPTANVAKPLDQEICNNSLTAKVAFSGTVSGTTYRWTNNHPEIGLAASGIGAEIAAFSAINNTAVPIIATIQVTPSNGCEGETRSFTITVNPNAAIALTSAPGTAGQTICINTPVAAITYLVTNATGAAVTGLPAGLTGKYEAGVFTIGGTPTVAGTFNYTVTTTGGCASASLSGTIKVNPNAEIALLSAVTTVNQTVCINSPVTAIVYKVSNATGAAVTGLPDGLSGVYNPATTEFTITGSSVQSGVFSYIVSTQGGCAIANLNGVIKVTPNSTIILSSDNGTDNQKVCVNTAIKQISYQTANASGAVVTGLPEGLTGLYKDGLFTINGMPKVSGTFNYTVTTIAACQTASMQGTIIVHPNPIGFNDIISNLTCANNTLNYQLQNNVNTISKGGNAVAASFSWTVAANQNVLGINSGSGNAITASLVNTSHVVQQVIYTVTPVSLSGGCPGTPFTVTVAVPVCSGLTLTKTADVNTVSQAGDLIKYTITVKNTASANHTGVTVTDPFLGGVLARPTSGDNGNNILEANESWIYKGTYSVKQTDIDDNGKPTAATGNIINTATVITAEHSGILSASATVNIVTTGAVTLVKTGIMSRDFSTIVYTFKIKNTGKVKLAELDLKDIKIPGEISLSKNTIAVGETITGTATYMVTDQEKRDGRVVNTATVTGKTPAGDLVTDVSGTQENNDTPTEFIIDDVPQAVNDRAETIINQPATFIVTENDMPSFNGLDKGSIIITRAPSNGQLIAHPDGTVTYTPNKGFSGQDDFMYTITDLKGKVSNKALVNITVTPIPVFIPNTFTPNGDGKNDTFKIIGRESFDTTDVLIFNRWGNEVYRNKNYNDEWDGSGLSEGTYYYLIILKKGDNQVSKKGWILIKR